MPKKTFLFIILFTGIYSFIAAQDTLPAVSVKNMSGKMILSWKNAYPQALKSISIQRSYDSLKFFSTIGSVLNPANSQNGFVDSKPPYNKMFYRLFIVFENSEFVFTRSYKPAIDNQKAPLSVVSVPALIIPEVKIPVVSNVFVPSKNVYTSKENTVVISIQDFLKNTFSVKFYDESEKYLFQIKNIPEPYLILEKFNFKHSGWFYFRLFKGDELIEKHKFFIAKDGKKPNSVE